MQYGYRELEVAEPFAEGFVQDPEFCRWVIEQTPFASSASSVRLMHEEMRARRSSTAGSWWRSYWTRKCGCGTCQPDRETDLLAIFETQGAFRFALHVEVKNSKDIFKRGGLQAEAYRKRAACWAQCAPRTVLPHNAAATVLLCGESKRNEFPAEAAEFDSVITLEAVLARFPNFYPPAL